MRRFPPLALTLALFAFLASTTPTAAAVPPGTIAYARWAETSTEVRLVEPDGTNDRRILSLPHSPVGDMPTLAWRHDTGMLALASDHEGATSLFSKDIYTVRPDGHGLRRLTNAPGLAALGGYAKGAVTVDVILARPGPATVYVVGAPGALTATRSTRLTFSDVADLGPEPQDVVGMEGGMRWYIRGADVQAGATVHAGTLLISGTSASRKADQPVWRGDGAAVGFTFGTGCGEFRQVVADPPLRDEGGVLIAPSSPFGAVCEAEWSPAAAAGQVLYGEGDLSTRSIYRADMDRRTRELVFSYDPTFNLLDLKWLPDASGFLVSFGEMRNARWASSNIYAYSFTTGELRPITRFSDEHAVGFSISPDGQMVAFERTARLEDPADLWLMRIDGSEIRLLAHNAFRPAWSPSAPQQAPLQQIFLPALRQ